jgi:hypothetical protein
MCEDFLGFNPLWIDRDLNPTGIRMCYMDYGDGDEFICLSAKSSIDGEDLIYETSEDSLPNFWQPLPEPPKIN